MVRAGRSRRLSTPRLWIKIAGVAVGVLVLLAIVGIIIGPQGKPAATSAAASSSRSSSSPPAPVPAIHSETAKAPAPSTPAAGTGNTPNPAPLEAAPAAVTCADVGGVFVVHGTDGRGDCEPADPRPECHVPPAQQDGNYLAELTMTPPFPGGTIDTPYMIGAASNADCWKAAGPWQMSPQSTS